MTSFLERYERGEHEQVWAELVALGAAVREEPVHADALAVAHETMRRAQANIDRLIPRLVRSGFPSATAGCSRLPPSRLAGASASGIARR